MNLQIRSMFDAEPTPNSLDENTLLSDLVINVTPKLRTQLHESAWRSRNERLTPRIPAQVEWPPQESGDTSTKQGGMPKLPKESYKKKNLPCFAPPKKNEPASLKRPRVHAQLDDDSLTSALIFDTCQSNTGPILVRALTTHTSHRHARTWNDKKKSNIDNETYG